MSVILFFVILGVLVFVHELGHFLAAKKFGVRVDGFGLGFPPAIWKKKVGETVYSINWIPFGGFVKIFGEAPDEESISGPDSSRSFVNIKRWKQAIVLVAGVSFNVIFAWVLFSIAYASGMTTIVAGTDEKYIENKHVLVLDALPESPASKAGFKSGDAINGYLAKSGTTSIATVEEVQALVKSSEGKPIVFDVSRGADKIGLTATPAKGVTGDDYAIGVSMDIAGKVKLPIHLAVVEGAKLTYGIFTGIAVNLYTLIHDAVLGQADLSEVSGPVGIARLVGDAGKLGFIYLLSFTAFISLNLAVLNLLPFPALDGGRVLFVAIEAIRRKAISPNVANTVNAIGFGILIIFMIYITVKDVIKLF